MSPDTQATIAALKRRAGRAFLRFHSTMEGYDCGNAMAKTVNPSASEAAQEYNACMAQLKALDPNCPEYTPL